jgi:hypothetical protein
LLGAAHADIANDTDYDERQISTESESLSDSITAREEFFCEGFAHDPY